MMRLFIFLKPCQIAHQEAVNRKIQRNLKYNLKNRDKIRKIHHKKKKISQTYK